MKFWRRYSLAYVRPSGYMKTWLHSIRQSWSLGLLFSPDVPVLAGTRVASIIEFGKIVHAEMSAITDAARRGLSVKDATLYCTTFPCQCVHGTLSHWHQTSCIYRAIPKEHGEGALQRLPGCR